MQLLRFQLLLDGHSMIFLQDFLEILGPYSLNDVTSTISSLDNDHQPRLISLGLDYVPHTFCCSIQLMKRPTNGSKEEKYIATASKIAIRILTIVHFLIMNISPLLSLVRVCWFVFVWLIVAAELLFFATLERFGLSLQTSLPKLDFVFKTELDKKTCLMKRLNNVPRAYLPSLAVLQKTWKLGCRFSIDFDFEFDCDVVKTCGNSIKLVMDSSCMLPTLEELASDVVSMIMGEYTSGKKRNAVLDGSRNLFAFTVAGKSLDVYMREVVISASVYFKLKGYIESHVKSASHAHRRTYSLSTDTETTDSLFSFTEMNPLLDIRGVMGTRQEQNNQYMDLASLVALDLIDLRLFDQDNRRLATASNLHFSSSSWYNNNHINTSGTKNRLQRLFGAGSTISGNLNGHIHDKATFYSNKYPARSEIISQMDHLQLYIIPDDDCHSIVIDGLSLMYASSANHDGCMSKLMTTSGQTLDVQCKRLNIDTSEEYLDHALGETTLRTIRYFCFGYNYAMETLLSDVEVTIKIDDIAVDVVCASTTQTNHQALAESCHHSYDAPSPSSGLAYDGDCLFPELCAVKIAMKNIECEYNTQNRGIIVTAEDFQEFVVELDCGTTSLSDMDFENEHLAAGDYDDLLSVEDGSESKDGYDLGNERRRNDSCYQKLPSSQRSYVLNRELRYEHELLWAPE